MSVSKQRLTATIHVCSQKITALNPIHKSKYMTLTSRYFFVCGKEKQAKKLDKHIILITSAIHAHIACYQYVLTGSRVGKQYINVSPII